MNEIQKKIKTTQTKNINNKKTKTNQTIDNVWTFEVNMYV